MTSALATRAPFRVIRPRMTVFDLKSISICAVPPLKSTFFAAADLVDPPKSTPVRATIRTVPAGTPSMRKLPAPSTGAVIGAPGSAPA